MACALLPRDPAPGCLRGGVALKQLTRLVAVAFATLLAPGLVLAQSVCVTNGDCTGGQVCVAGVCQPCVTDAQCTDGNACNGAETCQAGACVAGSRLNCDDGSPCRTDSCDQTAGCLHVPLLDGTSCSDGNVCNGAETCQLGVCSPGAPLNGNDSNPCTTDSCDPVAGCRNLAVANGTSCSDGTVCNGVETCQAGACTAGTALNCNDNNPCTTDTCDPLAGCQHTALVNGTPCPDGDLCNGVETCQAGVCTSGTPLSCNDNNACTTDGCDPVAGCRNVPVVNGTPCGDGNACNGAETCQAGACTAGTPLNCNDNNPCTTDTCDPVAGRQHTAAANGTSCSDGNACNGAETCQAGLCAPGVALNCNDSNPCTADTCDPVAGCRSTAGADGTPCSGGDGCYGRETCQGGGCDAGAAIY